MSKAVPILETRKLSKRFGGLVALRDLSFAVQRGEILGLIGPNGAGKTTVFNLITGLERPSSGDVFFQEKRITGKKPHAICKMGIARTYQNVRPFLNHTVRENIMVGVLYGRTEGRREENADDKAEEILSLLDLKSKQNVLAKNLPIEQRKLVEVGRALGANPILLLLDEPMAGLNPSEIAQFVSLMKDLNKRGTTIITVEHVMKAISSACSRVIVLRSGELLAEGTPDQVLSDKRVIESYLGESYGKT